MELMNCTTFMQWWGLFKFFGQAVFGSKRAVVAGSSWALGRRRFGTIPAGPGSIEFTKFRKNYPVSR